MDTIDAILCDRRRAYDRHCPLGLTLSPAWCCSPLTGYFTLQSHDKAHVGMHFTLTRALH